MRTFGPAILAVLLAGASAAEVIVFRNGDRVTGKIVSEGTRTIRLQTPYGRLAIPRARVEKIVHDDGTEEPINPLPELPPRANAPVKEPPFRLVCVITGTSFWYAWGKDKEAVVDPTLRLQVRLDEEPVATFADETLDQDVSAPIQNTFSFAPADVTYTTAPGVSTSPPEARPGRIVLKIEVPRGDPHERLGLAYQINEGTKSDPSWRDVASADLDLELRPNGPTFVHVLQDRGRMEFSGFPRRKMKNVDTFKLEARTATGSESP